MVARWMPCFVDLVACLQVTYIAMAISMKGGRMSIGTNMFMSQSAPGKADIISSGMDKDHSAAMYRKYPEKVVSHKSRSLRLACLYCCPSVTGEDLQVPPP